MQKKSKYHGVYLTVALMLAGTPSLCFSADPATKQAESQVPADDTGRNVRDRDENAKTADRQSNSKEDLEITRKIRRAIVEDKSLSTSAHNVKVVTVDRVVTLRGAQRQRESQCRGESREGRGRQQSRKSTRGGEALVGLA